MIRHIQTGAPAFAASEAALVLPLYGGTKRLSPGAAKLDRQAGSLASLLLADGFTGERGETRIASVKRGRRLVHTVLVGLGDPARADAENLSDAAGAAAKVLLAQRAPSAAIYLDDAAARGPLARADVAHAIAKAFGLATYQAGRKSAAGRMTRLSLLTAAPARELAPAIRRARQVVEWMERVRDWVNMPANEMTPSVFVAEATDALKKDRIACRALTRAQVEKAGMNGVLAVGAGSREEPRFLVAEYGMANRNLPLVCLVGKGVTFDSGGISIKPWEKMHEMKSDMAGAASVVAALSLAAQLELPLRVVALVPLVENMPDGTAFRPGDVIRLASGKTVEVLSTDAEGRLILADAVAYARAHYQPTVIVDMATLTGGVLIALGTRIAAVLGNSPRDLDDMIEAGTRSGEPVWQLPLDDRFVAMIKGDVSDYKNYGGRNGSVITAAALIGTSAGHARWVHIDIAGTSWNDGTGASYQSRGGTATGVDLLLRFLEIVAARS
ncbi:MAG TPA: leucyl aminopeptidase family protein [Candidatus Krumholzibacteria bacterium]